MIEFSAHLRNCFPVHPVPSEILIYRHLADCDSEEAALLLGVDWSRVDDFFWRDHWSAYYALSPSGFAYYLPSMLEYSIDDSYELIRDSLIRSFDTNCDLTVFSELVLERMELLTLAQTQCLIAWSKIMSEMSYFADKNEEDRVVLTLMMFEELKLR